MKVKSDKYTNGEFKSIKDLVNIEDTLLVSSQMANSLLLLDQHEKMIKGAQKNIDDKASEAPEPAAAKPSESDLRGEALEDDETLEPIEEPKGAAPPAPEKPV